PAQPGGSVARRPSRGCPGSDPGRLHRRVQRGLLEPPGGVPGAGYLAADVRAGTDPGRGPGARHAPPERRPGQRRVGSALGLPARPRRTRPRLLRSPRPPVTHRPAPCRPTAPPRPAHTAPHRPIPPRPSPVPRPLTTPSQPGACGNPSSRRLFAPGRAENLPDHERAAP